MTLGSRSDFVAILLGLSYTMEGVVVAVGDITNTVHTIYTVHVV